MVASREYHNEKIVSEGKKEEGRVGDSEQQRSKYSQLEQPREQMAEEAVHIDWMREFKAM